MARASPTCWVFPPPTLRRRFIAAGSCCNNDSTSEACMNCQSEQNAQVEAHLRAIWKGGSVGQPTWTPEQVRARAMRSGAHARRMGLGDLMGFLLLPIVVLGALLAVGFKTLTQQPFGRIQIAGEALLFLGS